MSIERMRMHTEWIGAMSAEDWAMIAGNPAKRKKVWAMSAEDWAMTAGNLAIRKKVWAMSAKDRVMRATQCHQAEL